MIARTLMVATCCLVPPAAGQSVPLFGFNIRGADTFYAADAADLLGTFEVRSTVSVGREVFALDFDENADELWAVERLTGQCGRVDLATGSVTTIGADSDLVGRCNGLTCAPDGTWYAAIESGRNTFLFVGDVTVANFVFRGIIGDELLFVDIAADSQGTLYGHCISDNSLYTIDPTDASATLVGPTGLVSEFAQGMDFDWRDDTLYAHLYQGGGAGVFGSLDLATGSITNPVITSGNTPELELEFAIRTTASGRRIGTNYCTSNPNSTGAVGALAGLGSASVADQSVLLRATSLPANRFGIFVVSRFPASPGPLAGSDGLLCLGSPLGRYRSASQIQSSGAAGTFELDIDLNAIPVGSAPVAVQPGDEWHFQAWFRETVGAGSNTTSALRIDFID